jgi:hypothetical protein
MKTTIACALALLALPLTAAAEKWGPTWSELTGRQWTKMEKYQMAAIIKKVDGKSETAKVVKVVPGKRSVVVQSPTRKGFSGTDATLDLDLAPCKRYFIKAKFRSGSGPDWDPVMAGVESIAGCKLPADAAKAAAPADPAKAAPAAAPAASAPDAAKK